MSKHFFVQILTYAAKQESEWVLHDCGL